MQGNLATWANALTALRVCLIPSLILSIQNNDWLIASTLFTFAVVSDVLDGKLARRFNQATPFGGLFDHLTDAVFVTVGCWALASAGYLTAWLPPLIIAAFAQYMLDSKALLGQPLRTSYVGRINGILYFVLLGVILGANLLGWAWLLIAASWTAWLLVASTLVSMTERAFTLIRLRRNN